MSRHSKPPSRDTVRHGAGWTPPPPRGKQLIRLERQDRRREQDAAERCLGRRLSHRAWKKLRFLPPDFWRELERQPADVVRAFVEGRELPASLGGVSA